MTVDTIDLQLVRQLLQEVTTCLPERRVVFEGWTLSPIRSPDENGYDHGGAHWDLLEERGFVRRSGEIQSKYRPDDVPMTYTATSLALHWARFAWDEDEVWERHSDRLLAILSAA